MAGSRGTAARPTHPTAAPARDGRSTRWDPHRRARRDVIVHAAIEAIELFGPDALTGQIAERAGVPRTHVYRHFDGKAALDRAVAAHVARDIGETIRSGLAEPGSARSLITGAIDNHLAWVEAHPNLYRFLAAQHFAVDRTGTRTSDDAKAAIAAELTAVLSQYLTLFALDTTPAEQVIVGVVGMVDSTAAWWLERDGLSRDDLAGRLTEQVWLVIDAMVRGLGLTIDPDAPLPTPPD